MTSIVKSLFLIIALPVSLFAQITWVWQNPLPQGQPLNGIYAFNTNTAIAVGGSSTVMKTTDGTSWQFQHSVDGEVNSLEAVYFVDTNIGYAVGAGDVVLKTTNGGATRTTNELGINNVLNALQFVDAQSGFCKLEGRRRREAIAGQIRSNDGGGLAAAS